ncbi:MAG: type II toxin-antitoxin system Phd/YefM family antitoxin [Alphaproteobacteria bacterium]|nr:type II toxin-antitoxin system Phd/YefM family antitoxin [Alphaproteobacteria bacterium]
MSDPVTIHAAKTHLSKLIARVEQGEEIIIARGDKPVARLVPIETTRKPRVPGRLQGLVDVGPEFFEPLPEDELRAWEGGDD